MKISSLSSKRKAKSSQKHSKKKTRSSREKTKKLKQRERERSISCSDEDLVSISSLSCSRSGDGMRSKKRGRSRDRKGRKDNKKNKRICLVSEFSGDDDSGRVKKVKRLKKNRSSDSRKKLHVKKRRRDRSLSSTRSRRSRSGEPSDDIDREFVDKAELKERKGREKIKESSESQKRSRHRSRSCSPCSLHSEEKIRIPKRLKSVIVVAKEIEAIEELESNKDDGDKDQIVFDYDDYPSKSVDSNDGVSVREAVPNLFDVSSKKRSMDEPEKEFDVSHAKALGVVDVERQLVKKSGEIIPSTVRLVHDFSIGNINEVTPNSSSHHADLETILRKKALENLLKRQGKMSTMNSAIKKPKLDIEVKKLSILDAQPVDRPLEGNTKSVQNLEKAIDDVKYFSTNLPCPLVGPSKITNAHLPSTKIETVYSQEKSKNPCDFLNSRPDANLSSSRKGFYGAKNTWKRHLLPHESSQKNLSSPREMIVKDSKQEMTCQPKLSEPQKTISNDFASSKFDSEVSTRIVEALTHTEPSTSEVENKNDKTNSTDEEAQFQNKTMSVMRGGEMVQVSYKVYIPKKTPALSRRQLKR
ncbi:uncharacterized protein LOC130809451 [Amaranthus tricolor]|uniref:uncharacterized protein LOC130809451 n=1 Tax=Amaranthus tricolor TaxID=29722 RepID=UPI00258E9F2A|nr:uncharacterized protein LOC130809451 [Amaranthus tricolor]